MPPDAPLERNDADRREQVLDIGRRAGLAAVGVTGVEPFTEVRDSLVQRRQDGLAATMQFTFRNPDRSTQPAGALPGARSLVVGALAYAAASPEQPAGAAVGRVARFATEDRYRVLRDALDVIAAHLRDEGWRTRVLVDDNALVDRAAAHRAGLGWWGRSSMLLVPGHGPWVLLGSVVTDAPLAPSTVGVRDGCGTCVRCIDGCPTGAIVGPGIVDARRCLSWVLQDEGSFPRSLRIALGDRLYGCDECQEVCPPGRSSIAPQAVSVADPTRTQPVGPWVDVVAMLELDDEHLLDRFGRWYVPRREPRYLRRNALVVLGNVADGGDPSVVRVLDAHLGHPDPMVRVHAVWAARRLGHHRRADAHLDDASAEVRAEADAPRPPPGPGSVDGPAAR